MIQRSALVKLQGRAMALRSFALVLIGGCAPLSKQSEMLTSTWEDGHLYGHRSSFVRIYSEPGGAEVFLDGTSVGTTPLSAELPPLVVEIPAVVEQRVRYRHVVEQEHFVPKETKPGHSHAVTVDWGTAAGGFSEDFKLPLAFEPKSVPAITTGTSSWQRTYSATPTENSIPRSTILPNGEATPLPHYLDTPGTLCPSASPVDLFFGDAKTCLYRYRYQGIVFDVATEGVEEIARTHTLEATLDGYQTLSRRITIPGGEDQIFFKLEWIPGRTGDLIISLDPPDASFEITGSIAGRAYELSDVDERTIFPAALTCFEREGDAVWFWDPALTDAATSFLHYKAEAEGFWTVKDDFAVRPGPENQLEIKLAKMTNRKVGMYTFEDRIGKDSDLGIYLADLMTDYLTGADFMDVIERPQLERLFRDKLDIGEVTVEDILRNGQVLNLDYVLLGTVNFENERYLLNARLVSLLDGVSVVHAGGIEACEKESAVRELATKLVEEASQVFRQQDIMGN